MSEYINRDDALNCFHDWVDKHGDVICADDTAEYIEIASLPSIEVVRCRDCKHSSVLLDEYDNECGHACNITYDAGGFWLEVEKDHFCGHGERGEADDSTGSD